MKDKEFKIESVMINGVVALRWHYLGRQFLTWFEVSTSEDGYTFFISKNIEGSNLDIEYIRNVSCSISNVGSDRKIYFA